MKMTLKAARGLTALTLLIPCALLCLQAGCKTNQPTVTELRPLQGTWEGFMTGAEADGKITVTITGNSLHFYRATNFWFETTITVPAGLEPHQMRATIKDGADKGSLGKVVIAIFKIEDGTLTLVGLQESVKEPPKKFPGATNDGLLFRYELKKVQNQKQNTDSNRSQHTGNGESTVWGERDSRAVFAGPAKI